MPHPSSWITQSNSARLRVWWMIGILALYAGIRLLAWKNTVLLEDTDSTSYIWYINFLLSGPGLAAILDLDADFAPFYAVFGTLFSLPGWSAETGARLCSYAFSIGLFFAVAGIGRRMASDLEVALGLLLITFSPTLISLSPAALTEPSYIATIYIGLWIFFTQYKTPTLAKAALLGLVFGLSFLNRFEGLIYVAVIPVLQLIHYLFDKARVYDLKHLARWSLVFIACFVIVIAPQIARVSIKSEKFALNGRQVYSIVVNNPDGKSLKEKLLGLDYSESTSNIDYLRAHPKLASGLASNINPSLYVTHFLQNLSGFYRVEFTPLIGPLTLIFFAFGLIVLYQSGRVAELLISLGFIGAALVPPLLHLPMPRHIAIILPLVLLVAGIGAVSIARILLDGTRAARHGLLPLSMALILSAILLFAAPLGKAILAPPTANDEYSLAEIQEPVRIVQKIADKELGHPPVIVGERAYVAHYTQGVAVDFPYTDMRRLVRYCELNNADFIYFTYRRVRENPFFLEYQRNGFPKNFILVYTGLDAYGDKVVLYRILSKPKQVPD